ncbi:alanyl-tRNA editing protein [Oscillibacter valericigenes]|uniref:alanyl-tRNA editing protein n=1 Tax=Oscillibacter valericigenes TaxID=351091 RepID=UPI001F1B0C02|nr:alanyl-tRNA editing protein [Oscillibacter valericigenes]MCF2663708.1 alanyl-tRNA editing protein [Oscillibacter valericigenes]
METEKLYYQDPFMGEFTATVLACEAGKTGFQVVLDRTAFYPEGGGQPADHGTLGGSNVTDVHEKDGVIFHTCDQAVEIGETVTGRIDWARRFDHMQQHSGEHIISGILCADYHCDNVGFHLGADTVTIDYNADISWDQALDAQRKANEVIWADQATEIAYPSPQELATLDYRSKKELTGKVRIVTFPEADCCACCGTHVLRAGQVGIIKVLSCQKFREGVRLEILCGKRALDYLCRTYDQARAIGQQLSVKPQDTLAAVERLEAELSAAKVRMAQLEEAVFESMARDNEGRGDVVLFQPPMKGDSVRKLADAVAKRCGGLAAVFAGEDGQYAYALVRADGTDIAPLVKDLNKALNGRGGGRGGFAQGSVQTDRAAIEVFFSK